MGLDMYLYSTGQNHRSEMKRLKKLRKEFDNWADALFNSPQYSELDRLLTARSTAENNKLAPKDEKQFQVLRSKYKTELKAKAESLGGVLGKCLDIQLPDKNQDPVEEIGYWRKNYDLHKYIVRNWGNQEDDDLVEIYLDEDAIEKMIETYPNEGVFKTAWSIVKCGGVVFYLAWY